MNQREVIVQELEKMGFETETPKGAFYVFPKMKDASRFVDPHFHEKKVITYKGEWFGQPEPIRIS
ncbi:MAG: hypothetical protein ACQESG_02120 [Nanobdellota archaeon]